MAPKNRSSTNKRRPLALLTALWFLVLAPSPAPARCPLSGPLPENSSDAWIDPVGSTIESRFRVPPGFARVQVEADSFAAYLRRLPLKPHPALVRLYDGRIKTNADIYDAVVDLAIGDKDLQQCADAVIRLRAEYLYRQGRFGEIHFNFSNGFRADYSEWMRGKRIVVQGNRAHWTQAHGPANAYRDFWAYLEAVFSYAGTRSLAGELKPARLADLQIGDVFIQGGSPGHAVIVVDLAVDSQAGATVFLLAQSYMPAQEIQILRNPGSGRQGKGPWYAVDFGATLATPEWIFSRDDLKRFAEP
ncbi:MAG: DUF4846 domain-containing protein [Candidatus Aminicenantes bacterium]|nr:DUF4846 domain-containing protein [Candidatus Aminicenantes bacterium]